MTFGFNPLLPGIRQPADVDRPVASRDFHFGVKGNARVLGSQTVKVPAGLQGARRARPLTQPGSPSGRAQNVVLRAGRGLVKLIFPPGDGSTSVVQLLR